MKTALIIVSIVGGLLLIYAGVVTYKMVKQNKILKDPKALWDKVVSTLPIYSTNADALEAGMKPGDMFKTPDNMPQIVVASTTTAG